MRRKLMAGVALAVALALAITGCASNANDNPSGASSGAGAGPGSDTLTAAFSEGGTTLDPAEANDVTSDTFVVAAYDQLITYGTQVVNGKTTAKTDQIVPMLAKSFKASPDGTSYTFDLRDDVTFASGKKMTAKDVVDSFAYIKASKSASFLYTMAGIDSVKADGDHTVVIKLTGPNHLFLQIIAMYSFSVMDMQTVKAKGGADWLARNTAGSGPYTVSKWDPATESVLLRNDKYWGTKPAIKSVDVKIIGEASNRVQLLQKGQVDITTEIPAKDVDMLKSTPGVTIDSRPSNKVLFFAMNNKIKPFDNEKVRQAVSYAIPYDQLINDVMKGQAGPMRSAAPSSMPGYTDAGFVYTHDLDKAKKLLAEAGYPDGFSFDFTLGSGFDDWNDDAVLIQAELAKIGVKMTIKNMARPQFLEALATGNVQSYITRWTSFVNDPGYHLGLLLTSSGTSNYANYHNTEVDSLWKKASTEQSLDKRNELYGQMQKIINTEAPWAYLYEYNIVLALRTGVDGYTSYPDGIIRFFQLSKSGS